MQKIIAPINPGDTGSQVANLIEGLLLIKEHGVLKVYDAPNESPTQAELDELALQARQEMDQQVYGEASVRLTCYFQIQQSLGIDLAGRIDPKTAERLNSFLQQNGVDFSDPENWIIEGSVLRVKTPVVGATVTVWDRDLRIPQQLGQASSNTDGRYHITFCTADFQRADKKTRPTPWLIIEAQADDATPPIKLEKSEGVQQHENIDIQFGAQEETTTEWEQISDAVLPLLEGQGDSESEQGDLPPAKIVESDFEFLAHETGLELKLLRAWVDANRLQQEALDRLGDGHESAQTFLQTRGGAFFYGYVRDHTNTTLDDILNLAPKDWLQSQQNAEAARWIPVMGDSEWPCFSAALSLLAKLRQLNPVKSPTHPLTQLLAITPVELSQPLALQALNLYQKKGLKAEIFQELASDYPDEAPALVRLARTVQLQDLTEGDLSLVKILDKQLNAESPTIEPLAHLSKTAWADLLKDSLPQIEPQAVTLKTYQLQAKLESQHPLTALAARVQEGAIRFQEPELANLEEQIAQHPKAIDGLLSGYTADTNLEVLPQVVQNTVRNLGRFSRSGLALEVAADLIKEGIDSPAAAMSHGPNVVMELVGEKYPPDYFERFFNKGNAIIKGMHGFISEVIADRFWPPILGEQQTELPAPLRENFPTLRGLFGDLDECTCRPCESVLGLPAYFVDLMGLLKKVPYMKENALTLLRNRRPDIYDLELSCDNAETEIPHIDLVLEVLENRVGLPYQFKVEPPPESPNPITEITDVLQPTVSRLLQAKLALTASVTGPSFQVREDQSFYYDAQKTRQRWFINDGSRRWTVVTDKQEFSVTITGLSFMRSTPGHAIKAAPENRNLLAYQRLEQAPFPWTLPFDLAHTETGLLLKRLGTDRAQLIPLQAVIANPDQLAAATLSIAFNQPQKIEPSTGNPPTAEWDLIVEPRAGAALWAAWGLKPSPEGGQVTVRDPASGALVSGAPKDVLAHVSILLDRSGVDLDTLELLLACQFIRGDSNLTIENREQCKTSQMTVRDLDEAHLDRLHRFIRLWKKLPGWSVPLLDSAILPRSAFPVLFKNVLQRVATIDLLAKRLRTPPSHLLAMYLPLTEVRVAPKAPGQPARNLYEQIFLAPTASLEQRSLFVLNNTAQTWNLDSVETAISAALGLRAVDLKWLIQQKIVTDPLSLDALTLLFRYRTLSKALNITVRQLHLMKLVCGIDPFGISFAQLKAFCEAVEFVQGSGLTIEETAYVLLPLDRLTRLGLPAPSHRSSAALVEERLKALQTTLRAAESEGVARVTGIELEQALAEWVTPEQAHTILVNLDDCVHGIAKTLPASLWEPPLVARQLGEAAPLFAEQEVTALFLPPTPPLLQPEAQRQELSKRQNILRERLAQRWPARLREQGLVATVATWTRWSLPLATYVLEHHLQLDTNQSFLDSSFWSGASAPPVAEASRPDLHDGMHRLDRLATLADTLQFPAGIWPLFQEVTVETGQGINWGMLLAPKTSPNPDAWKPFWMAWKAAVTLAKLIRNDRLSLATTEALFSNLREELPPDAEPTLTPLAARLAVSEAEVLALAHLAIANPLTAQTLRDPEALQRLWALAQALRTLGATAAQFGVLIDGLRNREAALIARQLLEAKVGQADWSAVLVTINDKLRIVQRDALVAYLVHRDSLVDANALYERYLIDPQIQPCMMTTRLLQAIAAVQLLAQRMLFGLEEHVTVPNAVPNNDNYYQVSALRRHWIWMRNYRVWEANRKVFLYPENWLFPELRDDKSSSFKQLEAALSQGELTAESANQAFEQFLDDVAQIGLIHVLGMYEDVVRQQNQGKEEIIRRDLYLVGRTSNPPYLYYWRRCADFGCTGMEWSPWKRIELDIQGDHVMIFLIRKDLYLAWPQFQFQPPQGQQQNAPGKWKITFSWSRLQGDKWSRIETTRDAQFVTEKPFRDERNGFAFRYISKGNAIQIISYSHEQISNLRTQEPRLIIEDTDEAFSYIPGIRNYKKFRDACEESRLSSKNNCLFMTDAGIPLPVNPLTVNLPMITSAISIYSEYWIRVKSSDNESRLGYVSLDTNNRLCQIMLSFSDRLPFKLDSRINLIWSGSFFQSGGSLLMSGPISKFKLKATLKLFPNTPEELSLSSDIQLGDVPINHHIYAVLKFVFKVEDEENIPTLEKLGIEEPKQFIPISQFNLTHTGNNLFTNNDSDGFELASLNTLDDCSAYLNGQREDSAGAKLTLRDRLPTIISGDIAGLVTIQPFVGSYNLDNRYWITGAVSNNFSYGRLGKHDIWYYEEGKNSCFIDAYCPGNERYKAFSTYASSYTEALEFRSDWLDDPQNFIDSRQACDFGSGFLPNIDENLGDGLFWKEQREKKLSFDARLPYANYNWEVFFHAPLLIADKLSKQQRFEDADRWLRFIFDPTNGAYGQNAKRFLRFDVFKKLDTRNTLAQQLTLLAQEAAGYITNTTSVPDKGGEE